MAELPETTISPDTLADIQDFIDDDDADDEDQPSPDTLAAIQDFIDEADSDDERPFSPDMLEAIQDYIDQDDAQRGPSMNGGKSSLTTYSN